MTFLTLSTLAQHLSMNWFGFDMPLTDLMALPLPNFDPHLPVKNPILRSLFTLSQLDGSLGAKLVLALYNTISTVEILVLRRAMASSEKSHEGSSNVKILEIKLFGGDISDKKFENFLWDIDLHFSTAKVAKTDKLNITKIYLTVRAQAMPASVRKATWLILLVFICLSQRLSHACINALKKEMALLRAQFDEQSMEFLNAYEALTLLAWDQGKGTENLIKLIRKGKEKKDGQNDKEDKGKTSMNAGNTKNKDGNTKGCWTFGGPHLAKSVPNRERVNAMVSGNVNQVGGEEVIAALAKFLGLSLNQMSLLNVVGDSPKPFNPHIYLINIEMKVDGNYMMAIVDTGATHMFADVKVATKYGLKLKKSPPYVQTGRLSLYDANVNEEYYLVDHGEGLCRNGGLPKAKDRGTRHTGLDGLARVQNLCMSFGGRDSREDDLLLLEDDKRLEMCSPSDKSNDHGRRCLKELMAPRHHEPHELRNQYGNYPARHYYGHWCTKTPIWAPRHQWAMGTVYHEQMAPRHHGHCAQHLLLGIGVSVGHASMEHLNAWDVSYVQHVQLVGIIRYGRCSGHRSSLASMFLTTLENMEDQMSSMTGRTYYCISSPR
ncbi:hypothetical protein T459_34730 [Capsicum annuum]|uniref:Uncharacterized protein n=1 Tax=Capsicum annuum TaxID=4072 RepID=A0A2G2XVT5_CAPAN|nr:hypothetical protein T459_34730 [Capsicum annuum]